MKWVFDFTIADEYVHYYSQKISLLLYICIYFSTIDISMHVLIIPPEFEVSDIRYYRPNIMQRITYIRY